LEDASIVNAARLEKRQTAKRVHEIHGIVVEGPPFLIQLKGEFPAFNRYQ
jgi:hypothetical protein